jgi:hypothetical protein
VLVLKVYLLFNGIRKDNRIDVNIDPWRSIFGLRKDVCLILKVSRDIDDDPSVILSRNGFNFNDFFDIRDEGWLLGGMGLTSGFGSAFSSGSRFSLAFPFFFLSKLYLILFSILFL